MEAASPCFNRSGGPPSVRSTSNHRQLAFFCAAVVHPLLPNPGAAPNPFYHMIPASPVGDGAVHRSWLIPPAPLRLRSRILHPSLKNVAPTFFQRASDSSAFLQLDMLLHRCSRGHPLHRQHPLSGQPAARGGLELQLEEVSTCSLSRMSLPPRSTTYGRRCSNHPPPLSVADACNHVQPPTGCGHRGRAMPRELELHHPQPVPLQVAAEKQKAEVQDEI
ncbi:uncharacterized protein LOC119342078 isoform X3 [Triticum dicoccoides]|uniref:uncharacterized protein LOC119342078 isoform X3 n=1 Tax=Triticum dicoccoides TaxID=85692 RepID=UPI0018910475|nr:uncharacterized protein LOC119342078 isoform X3 [Triticum dicoccoides]